jgi:hypothetical protein
MKTPHAIVGLSLIVALGGCKTLENYRANKAAADTVMPACQLEAFDKYPAKMYSKNVTLSRQVPVYGNYETVCDTDGSVLGSSYSGKTKCRKARTLTSGLPTGYKRESWQDTVTKDANKEPRDIWINQCFKAACLRKYGDEKCKVAK